MILTILAILLLISILVVVHEMGHLLVAKWQKLDVEEFGLGYPPTAKKLFSWGETVFTLNWIPFGGFVRLTGEYEQDLEEQEIHSASKRQFYNASLVSQLLVILAGPVANLIFGIFAFAVVIFHVGIPSNLAIIGDVMPNSPAAAAGLLSNRQILAISGADWHQAVVTPDDVIAITQQHRGASLTLHLSGECEATNCGDEMEQVTVYVRQLEETPEGEGSIGFGFMQPGYVRYPFLEMVFRSLALSIEQTGWLVRMSISALKDSVWRLVAKAELPADVAGPVGIVHQTYQHDILQQGGIGIANYLGLLSVGLATFNLLPILPLDGGRALTLILKKILPKNLGDKIEISANYIGIGFIALLFFSITASDLIKLFS